MRIVLFSPYTHDYIKTYQCILIAKLARTSTYDFKTDNNNLLAHKERKANVCSQSKGDSWHQYV